MKSGPFTTEKDGFRVGHPTQTMVQTRLRVLGRFSLELADVTAPSLATQKARAILAYLVAHRKSDVARERLLEIFWSEATPDAARDGLRSTLWSIRRSIKDAGFDPNEYLVANRTLVRWKARSWLDSEAFLELARSDDAVDLEASLELYKGDFLEGDYEEWTVSERDRLSDEYDTVLARLVQIARNHDAAQLLLSRNPYDEPSYLLLIEDELSAGRIVAAAALAERCERALSEVGAQPSEALRELVAGISSRRIQNVGKLVLPFVGRQNELSKVRNRLDGDTGSCILVVSGEAGIGKSAFLSRSADIAQSSHRSAVTIRCFDTDSRPFGPFEELYANLHGEPFNALVSREHLEAARHLADSIVKSLDPSAIVLIDDAHTLTADARGVLSALANSACSLRRMLLIATRTEGLQDVTSAVSGCAHETIVLGPLPFDDLRAAIDSVLTDGGERVAITVFERSGGHPLFAASLLDSLTQSGVLRSESGNWHLAAPLDERMPLPKTLATYIHTRLRARGEKAATLAAALSLEPTATSDDLTAVLHLPEDDILNAIDDLLALGVLTQPASVSQVAFAHDLYREVAGTMLNAGRRTRLHRAFAQRFASLASPESSVRCARHLSLAGEATAAAEAYYRAATEALEWRAALEARDRCIAGISQLENLERKQEIELLLASLKMLLSKAQAALGDAPSAIASANDAIVVAKRIGDGKTAIEAALVRQSLLLDDYDAAGVLASSQEVVLMARDAHDDASLSIALADQSWAQRLLGYEEAAFHAAHEAERAAAASGDYDLESYALEQIILTGITWWKFTDGKDAAARSLLVMSRASRLARIALQCAIASLNLALEHRRDASSAISAATALFQEDDDESTRMPAHTPFRQIRLKLEVDATAARLALSEGDMHRALTMAAELENVALPRARQLASLFRAEAHFELALPDVTPAMVLQRGQFFMQDVYTGSRSPDLAETLGAVTASVNDAQERVLRALDRVEAAARRTPVEADHAFALLERAADKCGAEHVALRARLRSRDYSAARALATSRIAGTDRTDPKNA